MSTRRAFTREFKIEAVALVTRQGLTRISHNAGFLGQISRRWSFWERRDLAWSSNELPAVVRRVSLGLRSCKFASFCRGDGSEDSASDVRRTPRTGPTGAEGAW